MDVCGVGVRLSASVGGQKTLDQQQQHQQRQQLQQQQTQQTFLNNYVVLIVVFRKNDSKFFCFETSLG